MSAHQYERPLIAIGSGAKGTLAARSWHVLIAFAVVSTAVLVALWPSWKSVALLWDDKEILSYTHGWLVAAICVVLLGRACFRSADQRVSISWSAALLLALASFLWLLMWRAAIAVGHQMLLPVLSWLAICAAFGRAFASRTTFALAYLYFALPVWSLGNGILQALTVAAVKALLRLSGVPAYFEGNLVHIPSGVFEIAGGCSGLHFFIVAIAIAALYGEVSRDSLRVRLLTIALGGVLAIVSNWVRVFTIIIAGHLTDMQHYLIRVDHYYFGWFVFALAMCAFFLIARCLPLSTASAPLTRGRARPPANPGCLVLGTVAAIAALCVGPVWSMASPITPAPLVWHTPLPDSVERWIVDQTSREVWKPVFVGADVEEQRTYRDGERTVTVYVASYFSQHQNKELIGHDNSVLGRGVAQEDRVDQLGPDELPVVELIVLDGNGRSVLWYFYEVDAARLTSSMAVQLISGLKSLVGSPVASVTALRAACSDTCQAAREQVKELYSALRAKSVPMGAER